MAWLYVILALVAGVLVACSPGRQSPTEPPGGPPLAPAPIAVAPETASVPRTGEPILPPPALGPLDVAGEPGPELALRRPFGCDVLAIDPDGFAVRGPIDIGGEDFVEMSEDGGAVPVPPRLASGLPELGALVRIGVAGPCTCAAGPPMFVDREGRPFVGHALSGCPTDGAPFVLRCPRRDAVPETLRWAPLPRARNDALRGGELGDELVELAFSSLADVLRPSARAQLAVDLASVRDGGVYDLRRSAVAALAAGDDALCIVTVQHAFFASEAAVDDAAACPSEVIATFVFVRIGDSWRRAASGHGWVGALTHRTHFVGLVQRWNGEGRSESDVVCWGAAGCDAVTIHGRTPVGDLAAGGYGLSNFTSGNRLWFEPLSYRRERCTDW